MARDFKLKGWKQWSFEDQEIFQKWVFSQCGAVTARLRGDDVQPFNYGGIGVQEM